MGVKPLKVNSSLKESLKDHIKQYFQILEHTNLENSLYEKVIKEVELVLIQETLEITNGVQSQTARILGINRNTLRKKMLELGINKGDDK